MHYRSLGRTGWNVSVVSFGGIKLPQLSQSACDSLLNPGGAASTPDC